MFSSAIYHIYGLRLRSDLPLPVASVSDDGEIDLIVRNRGAIPLPVAPPPPVMTVDWREEEQRWRLHYHTREGRVLEFCLNKQATCIDIYCTCPQAIDDIAAVLLGPALASALHLRGIPILHASAVVVDGRAILVAGMTGAGKSTLAAALVRLGAPLLAEDLAVLTFGENAIAVQAGYPRLRLCPDATLVADKAAPDLPRVFSAFVPDDKRWLDAADLAGGFCATPAPLGGIYLLAPRRPDRKAPAIEPLPPHRAALALLDHLYGTRWLRIPKPQALEWCARIAGETPVRWVHAPPGLEQVNETADAIIADARCLAAAAEPIAHRQNRR
jgi:hypothetical protein